MAEPITAQAPLDTRGQRLRASIAAQRRSRSSSANRLRDGLSIAPLRATSGPPAGAEAVNAASVEPDRGRRSASLLDLPSSGRSLVDRLRAQIRPSSPLNALSGQTSPASAAVDSTTTAASSARAAGDVTPDGGGADGGRQTLTLTLGRAPTGADNPFAGLVTPAARFSAGLFSSSRTTADARLESLADAGTSGGLPAASDRSMSAANAVRASLRSSFARSDSGSRLLLSLGSANRSQGGFGLAAFTRSVFDRIG